MNEELIHQCQDCRIEHYESKEVETNVTIILELPLTSIMKILTESKGLTGDQIKQILRQLSDCKPNLCLTNKNQWVP